MDQHEWEEKREELEEQIADLSAERERLWFQVEDFRCKFRQIESLRYMEWMPPSMVAKEAISTALKALGKEW